MLVQTLPLSFSRPRTSASRPKERHRFQIAFTFICFPMYSAWRIARVTMVSVGFSAAPVVNWLPSETNRFLMSWLLPHLLHTPSAGFALIRQVPRLWVEGYGSTS